MSHAQAWYQTPTYTDKDGVLIILLLTVLSQASAHTQVSAHPPILTVLWFFKVLRVTAHRAKFLRIESAELT